MKGIFLSLFIAIQMASVSVLADQQNKTLESGLGNIPYSTIEEALSLRFNVPVFVLSIRWPYNPSAYSNYIFGKFNNNFFGSENFWETYVISLYLDNKHNAFCEFTIYLGKDKITLSECNSSTTRVRHESFNYSDFDLNSTFENVDN